MNFVYAPHRTPHFDARGHCVCSCRGCQGNEGKCLCAVCPCNQIGQCEGESGTCPKCSAVWGTA